MRRTWLICEVRSPGWVKWMILVCLVGAITGIRSAAASAEAITHGPMLGQLTSNSIRVWVRARAPGSFSVTLSENASPTAGQRTFSGNTTLASDNTGWLEITGLRANTKYNYVVHLPNESPSVPTGTLGGSFRTLPDESLYRDPAHNPEGRFNFSFEVGSCNRQRLNTERQFGRPTDAIYATMYDRIREQVHFHILNGDWIYEESATWPWHAGRAREVTTEQWARENRVETVPDSVSHASGITGVWENYKLYLSRGTHLAAFHRHVPLFAMFDDHEIYNDIMGAGEVGLRVDATTPELRGSPFPTSPDDPRRNPIGPGGFRLIDGSGFRPRLRTLAGEVERSVFRDPALQAWLDYIGWANPNVKPQTRIHLGSGVLDAGQATLVDAAADFDRWDLQSGNLHVHWGHRNSGVYAIRDRVDRKTLKIEPAPVATERVTYSVGATHYYQNRIGNCEFFVLDTRSFRTRSNPQDPHDPRPAMLGRRQLEWLKDGIEKTDATFIFVVSSVSFMIPHANVGSSRGKDESYTAYAAERAEVLRLFASKNRPIMVLSGDIHNAAAIRIGPKVWEFLCGPHMSPNHNIADMGGMPLTGQFNSHGHEVTVRWATGTLSDAPKWSLPTYCVVKVNNAFDSPDTAQRSRWVAYDIPQVIFQFFDGLTGDLRYAETVTAR